MDWVAVNDWHKSLTNMLSMLSQAALIAKQANVNQLIIGHYSSRYNNIDLFKQEAELVFDNVVLAEEGKVISVNS